MIGVATCCWALTSLLIGVAHSLGIRQACRNPRGWLAALGILRLFGVGAVLTTAAIWGYLFSAFGGWLVGWLVSLGVFWGAGD